MGRYPFRYYGADPADWVEGANAGHEFTVQFARVPSDDEQGALGRAYQVALRTGRAEPVRHGWSGRFLQLVLGERGRGSGGADHVGPVTRFLREAHAIVPITDAIYHNAREGIDAWSQWSLDQQPPDPRPGAGSQRFELYAHAGDASLPPFAPSPAFTDGERHAAEEKHRARIDDEVHAQRAEPVHLVRVHDVPGAAEAPSRSGWTVAADVLAEGERVRSTVEVLGGSHLAVATNQRLMLMDLGVSPSVVVHEAKTPRRQLRAVLGGRVLLAEKDTGDSIFAVLEDRLVQIGSTNVMRALSFERAGRVYFGPEDHRFELVGLVDALEAATRAPRPARRKKPAARAPAATLTPVDAPPPALIDQLSLEGSARQREHPRDKVAECASGAYAIATSSGTHRTKLVHCASDGTRTDLTAAIAPHLVETILGIVMPPGGGFVFVWTHGRILRVQVAPIVVETAVETGMKQRPKNPEAPADDLVVYVDGTHAHWCRRADDGTWSAVGDGKISEASYVIAASEEIAVIYAKDPLKRSKPTYPLRVWGLGPKGPRELGKFATLGMRAGHHDGQWFVRDHRGNVFAIAFATDG